MTDLDALCAEYLSQLDGALRDRSVPQRRQIVEQITEHLNEARGELTVQSEAAVRSILERLGRPEDIAAAAAAGEGVVVVPPSAPRFTQRKVIQLLAAVVVFAALGITVGLLATKGSTPPRSAIGNTQTTTTSTVQSAAQTLIVPVVIGETIVQATTAIEASGLTVQGIEGDPNGVVVAQAPSGGSRVPSGSEITLHTQPAPSAPST